MRRRVKEAMTTLRLIGVAGLALAIGGARWDRPASPALAVDAWTLVYPRPATGKYEDFAFPNDHDGWLVTARGDILHTTDGGVHWVSQASGLSGLRSIDFYDEKHGFAGSLQGRLYATTDGGATWNDITNTLPASAKGFCGMTHVGRQVHIVGRYNLGATDYFYSRDGGKTWQHSDLNAMAQGLVDVMFLDQNTGFIGGMAKSGPPGAGPAVILKTTDGGKHWHPVFEPAGGRGFVWKLFPINKKLIYASLQSQDGVERIAKTTDSGEHWDTLTVATGQPHSPGLQGIGFLDENVGFVGGFHRTLYATTDGGKTWAEVSTIDLGLVNRFERVGKTLITAGAKGVYRFDGLP
jgi:photosystem II stability/assembly factor-like uncharacterized protein